MRQERNQKHFSIRLPSELREWLEVEANKRFQSINGLLVELVRQEKIREDKKSQK